MSLQKRLTWLLTAFAGFGLVVTFGTIHAVRLNVGNASTGLQGSMEDANWVDHVRVQAREQHVALWEVVYGLRAADELYRAERDGFFDELNQVPLYTLAGREASDAEELSELTARLKHDFELCLEFAQSGETEKARALLRAPLEAELLPALEERLQHVLVALEDSRERSVDEVVGSNTQVLILSLVVGVFGVGLVAVGTMLVRRWIIAPVRGLSEATREFSGGNLDYRLRSQSQDELGALGQAMNQMAAGLSDAQAEILVSEEKHRSLFRNLRDATLVCDARGRVLECHDGDTHLLGKWAPDCSGRSLGEFWQRWQSELPDWPILLERVLSRETQVRLSDLKLQVDSVGEQTAIVDLIAYRVEFGHVPHVAIVLRDVTERRRLERQTRRTEAMEATVTFARGVAHDFNSLLTSAIGSLSQLSSEISDGRLASQLRRALRACGQAVGLSRALQGFAGGDRGNPEVLSLRETVELILDSLDEKFFAGIRVRTDLSDAVRAEIDRDQFTQIVLNLVRNAREAMPDGGDLHIKVEAARLASSPEPDAPSSHALLTVSDAGCGITPEVRERLFEPFFTTKARGSRRSRGLGLAVVYAAVKNANGLIEVEGEPGVGTTFRVYLPLWEKPFTGRVPPRDASREGAPHAG